MAFLIIVAHLINHLYVMKTKKLKNKVSGPKERERQI